MDATYRLIVIIKHRFASHCSVPTSCVLMLSLKRQDALTVLTLSCILQLCADRASRIGQDRCRPPF